MAKDLIVAIELGSSKMTGIAGRKNPDGSISILAVAKEDSTQYIRKGVAYNIERTAQGLSNIVNKLKNTLKTEIAQVYVGIGGQSIHSVKNPVIKELPQDTIVSQEMVNELMDTNRSMVYPDYEILDAITEEYKVGALFQDDPIGIQAEHLEGNFLNVLWRRSFYRNINKSLDNAGIKVAEMYLAPLAMADSVLTEAEKRAGCVLVDLGAETTTVSVYYRDKLRHIAVLPLGGSNVTKDLESLQIDEINAEAMKLKHASALTNEKDIDADATLPIGDGRTILSRKFIQVVEARMLEIVENVKYLVPHEFADKLLGGIVLTGGGSNMKNVEKLFHEVFGAEKVRIAKSTTLNINKKDSDVILSEDGTTNTILGLLAKGDMNCAGRAISDTLFDDEENGEHTTITLDPNATTGTPVAGQTAATGPVAAATATQTATTATTAAVDEKEEEDEKEPEAQKDTKISRWFGSLKKFGRSLVEPDVNE
ncbi:cell division protein FtsA [Leyella stercorea]|uniref:cell division protein FtsA n=1 Tax=Leyella stercorea TaxID=363265 RepID=UPI00242C7127|nr:cell division protein FtsA [Leyella stercorea]